MQKRKFLVVLLTVIMSLCVCFAFACKDKNGPTPEPTPTKSDWTYEFMSDIMIPIEGIFSGVSEEQMLDGSVTYRFKSPEYENEEGKLVRDVTESVFPNVYLDRVGEWIVVYFRGDKAVAKTFEVKDTIAPEVSFTSTSYDVYVTIENEDEAGEDGYEPEYRKYSIPTAEASDLSGIDLESRIDSVKLYVNENDPAYDAANPVIDLNVDVVGRYTPKATGKIEYTIKVADIYGNYTEKVLTWNVKDPNWTDNELADGYLADYDDAGYINSVRQGWVASYWADSQIVEEWYETFEGANGVLKVSAAPNRHAQGCFEFTLPVGATKADLEDKYLMLKIYPANDLPYLYFGCNTYDNVSDMKHAFKFNVVPNEWNYVVLSTAELNYGYFNRGETEIGKFNICFGEYNGLKLAKDAEIYIDSVTIAEDLESVKNIVIDEDKLLSWSPVNGATAYEVIEGDNVTVTEETTYQVTDERAKIGVRALATNPLYVTQAVHTPFIDLNAFGDKDLALFDTPSYELLAIKNPFSAARQAAEIKAEYLESYKGVQNVLKVTTVTNNVQGTWGVGDITLMLPKASTGTFTIKFLAEETDATVMRFLQPTSEYGWDNLTDIPDNGEWQTWFINYTKDCWVSGGVPYDQIDIMIQGGVPGSENVMYFALVQDGDTVLDIEMADVTATLKDGELATYDSDRYLLATSVDACPYHGGTCDHVLDMSYVESYTDSNGLTQNGLLKIDITNCSNRKDAGWVLKLLKEHCGTYTIRYLLHVEEDDTATATIVTRKVNAKGGVIANESGIDITADVWHTKAITTESENKKMVSMYNYGPNAKFTLYVDGVWDGNRVVELELASAKENLKDGELATYDSALYTLTLDAMYSPYQGSDYLVTAEYLESYQGKDGVIKLNVKADKDGNNAEFVLKLLKAHTGTYTIKYYIEVPEGNTAPGAVQIKKSDEYGVNGVTPDASLNIVSGWQTLVVNSVSELKDSLYFYAYGAGSNFNIYIDGVWDGDASAEEDPSAPDIFA